uniref:Uncharacterized protein n=1 Tax=Solanum lycopersicum TaxID=4081 RepID=A0A3Q7GE07_SOLLC
MKMTEYKKICTSISITFTNFIKCYEFNGVNKIGKCYIREIQPMRDRHLARKWRFQRRRPLVAVMAAWYKRKKTVIRTAF